MKRMFMLVLALVIALPAIAQDKAADAKLQSDLVAKEKALWDAFFKKDLKAFSTMLADDGIFADSMGITTKADMIKGIAGVNCKIKSYSFADEKMSRIDEDAVILTFKAAQDGTCDGQKIPATTFVTSTWVKRNGKWVGFSHTETPAMPPPPPAKKK